MKVGVRKPYQPEIDGLRAIAVTAVVLSHVGVPGFSGGFVGVDIFFVISGFLITRLLFAELVQSKKIDLVAFYVGRIRRLLPALTAVILVVLLLGTFILTAAGELQDLSASAVATVAFVSNIYFWQSQSHYFADRAAWIPLLNTWTLSVEEQFYLAWPAVLLLAAFIARRTRLKLPVIIASALALLFLPSFALFWWGVQVKPTAAFYLTPTRGWEFVVGSALALTEKSLARMARAATPMALTGIAAIAVAVFINHWTKSYAIAVLLATFGTAAMIASISTLSQTFTTRVLQTTPFVVVGKLSYSWYLWHGPLLALTRIHELGQEDRFRDSLVAFVALGLAALTYVLLENPIRRRKPWPFSKSSTTLAVAATISLATAALAFVLLIHSNAAARRDPLLNALNAALNDRVPLPSSCLVANGFASLAPVEICLLGAVNGPRRILVWGDSNAQHFLAMVAKHGTQNGYRVVARPMSSCPPLPKLKPQTIDARLQRACVSFNDAVARELPALAQAGLKGIVIASRDFGFPAEKRRADALERAEGPAAIPNPDSQQLILVWKQYLRDTLSTAQRAGLRILVIAPVPIFDVPVPRCLAHRSAEQCSADRLSVERIRAPLLQALRETVAEFGNARMWDPLDVLCDQNTCAPARDGVVLYRDYDHLSMSGSRYLEAFAAPELNWLAGTQ